tara:strand:+ start:779 stop:982 length:204 start_codon:yes stop_codon:yes gene_type:complete
MYKNTISVGDKFFIEHGGNTQGPGTALFIATRITKAGNVFGEKWNVKMTRLFNEKYKLNFDRIKGTA